jgi:hypothetical protein
MAGRFVKQSIELLATSLAFMLVIRTNVRSSVREEQAPRKSATICTYARSDRSPRSLPGVLRAGRVAPGVIGATLTDPRAEFALKTSRLAGTRSGHLWHGLSGRGSEGAGALALVFSAIMLGIGPFNSYAAATIRAVTP